MAGGNKSLQARAGQNAPFRSFGQAATRGRLAKTVELVNAVVSQTLIAAVDEPVLVSGGFGSLSCGNIVGTSGPGVAGSVRFESQGTTFGPFVSSLYSVGAMLRARVGVAFDGIFVLAPGERLYFIADADGPGTGLFYPDAGLFPQDLSVKTYRVELPLDGTRKLVAQAPPGKALVGIFGVVPVSVFGTTGLVRSVGGLLSASLGGPFPSARFFIDGVEVGTQTFGPGFTYLPLSKFTATGPTPSSGAPLIVPDGAALEAELVGGGAVAAGSRFWVAMALQADNVEETT